MRRTDVSEAAVILQNARRIPYNQAHILNRKGPEAGFCASYQIIKTMSARLLKARFIPVKTRKFSMPGRGQNILLRDCYVQDPSSSKGNGRGLWSLRLPVSQ